MLYQKEAQGDWSQMQGTGTCKDVLASRDKAWKSYPNYAHDSEFKTDRSQMDDDIVACIQAQAHASTYFPR